MTNSRRLSRHGLRAILVLLVAMVATSPAYAKTQPHKLFPTSASNVSLTKAQKTSIASSLKSSTGLKPSQLTTKNYCDTARKGHVTCDLEVLVAKRTHSPVHVRVKAQRQGTSHLLRSWASNLSAVGVTPDTAPASSPEPGSGTPAWLQQAYDATWLSANSGTGKTVAIVDAYDDPTAATDLATYRSYFGLPACTAANGCFTELNQSGQTRSQASSWPAADSDWNMEESMDLDAVSALCPNCHIVFVEANSSSWSDLNAAESAAENYSGVSVISNSFGSLSNGAPTAGAFGDANVSIVASTGDNGYQGTDGSSYPAAFGNVVAAGGSSLTTGSVTGSRGFSETAWDGAGSACNTYVSKPSWQTGACAGRSIADLSADADPNTGIAFYDTSGGGWEQAGGTSLSSPLIAAFEAISSASTNTGQWAYTDASLLNDITSGSNDTASLDAHGKCTTALAYLCTARAGYDGPTGNGSISGEIATGGPGVGGPDVCTASSCTSGSEGYESASTSTTATLSADVYPNGLATTYYWQYGTSTGFGSQTTSAVAGAAAAPAAVSSTLSGLAAGTTYYYRLVATNNDGTVYGYTFSFSTGQGPSNSSAPTITGTAAEGSKLTAGVGSWAGSPTSYTYQWQLNTGGGFANISGATATTLTLGAAELGGTVEVVVTAKNASGSGSAASAATSAVASGAPANTAAPSISGASLKEGVRLTAAVGSWSPAASSYSYQWQLNTGSGFTNISGATGSTYTPGVAALGGHIQVLVTGKNTYGSAVATGSISGTVASGAPVNTVAPVLSGTAKRTDTLKVTGGTWSPTGTVSYKWERCSGGTCTAISGATKSSYVATVTDEADTLKVVVTATNTYGAASVTTSATGAVASFAPATTGTPTISGTDKQGDTLTAHAGTWTPSGPSYSYQWLSCNGSSCSAISGATGSTHKLTSDDAGGTIEVRVTNTNVDGSTSKTSAKTATIKS